MPVYTESVKQLIFQEDIDKMMQSTPYESERVIIALLWFTGARPIEIISLKRKNVLWGIDQNGMDFFQIKLPTAKLANAQGFVVNERVLTSSRPLGMKANIGVETIIRFCMKLEPEEYVIVGGRTTRWLNKVVHKLSVVVGHTWCVYTFRHSCLSHMARAHASINDLMMWKGASHPSSVMRYIHAAPAYIQIENQNRSRDLYSKPKKEVNERYTAKVIQRPATKEEIETLPTVEKEEASEEDK